MIYQHLWKGFSGEGEAACRGYWKEDFCGMGTECKARPKGLRHRQSNHEEADTKMILHALDASADGVTHFSIHSLDTDVLDQAIRRYPEMCTNILGLKEGHGFPLLPKR